MRRDPDRSKISGSTVLASRIRISGKRGNVQVFTICSLHEPCRDDQDFNIEINYFVPGFVEAPLAENQLDAFISDDNPSACSAPNHKLLDLNHLLILLNLAAVIPNQSSRTVSLS